MPRAHTILGRVAMHAGVICVTLTAAPAAFAQIELGHKVLGALGIDAGTQLPTGVYLGVRAIRFDASEVRDRNGDVIPLPGLDVEALGGGFGAAYVIKPGGAPYLTFAVSAPLAKLSLSIDDPRVNVDRSGFGDMYVLPVHAGWRSDRYDAVASYGVYVPTGRFEPRGSGGVGQGFWTHQFSLGGAIFFSKDRSRRLSALASYDVNSRKRGIDIRRGSTVQVQAGAGMDIGHAKALTLGVAAYALWQVSDDRGADIPPVLRDLKDRVFGLGPELQLNLPVGLQAEVRSMWDFGARARAVGVVVVAGLGYRL